MATWMEIMNKISDDYRIMQVEYPFQKFTCLTALETQRSAGLVMASNGTNNCNKKPNSFPYKNQARAWEVGSWRQNKSGREIKQPLVFNACG